MAGLIIEGLSDKRHVVETDDSQSQSECRVHRSKRLQQSSGRRRHILYGDYDRQSCTVYDDDGTENDVSDLQVVSVSKAQTVLSAGPPFLTEDENTCTSFAAEEDEDV